MSGVHTAHAAIAANAMASSSRSRARRIGLWLVLSLPALWLCHQLGGDDALPMDLLRPSGEFAVRLMVLALLPGPLAEVLGHTRVLRAWLAIRRDLGVAAAAYALLHLVIYVVDIGRVDALLDEIALPGIWTGWLALGFLLVPAAISSDRVQLALGRLWNRLQRLVYPALLLAFVHWLLLDHQWQAAIAHAAPLALAWALRGAWRLRRLQSKETT
jgi:sulfoxide reductase heme-binding subunit YedZ